MPNSVRPDDLESVKLPHDAVAMAEAVAESRGHPVASYLMGAIRDATSLVRGGDPTMISNLVVARIGADHAWVSRSPDKIEVEPSSIPIAASQAPPGVAVAIAGPGLRRKTRDVARSRGISVGDYVCELYGRVDPPGGPTSSIFEFAARMAALIRSDFARLTVAGD